jgi:hypothetical protein
MQGDGDVVTATAVPGQPGVVRIDAIAGDNGRLTLDASKNCVGIAAAEVVALLETSLGSPLACGVALQLQKVHPVLPAATLVSHVRARGRGKKPEAVHIAWTDSRWRGQTAGLT